MTPWMPIAWYELGVHETSGTASTARIIEYDSATTLKATSDDVPWCSAFANWVMARAGIPGTRSALARSWLTWGSSVGEQYGAIVVLARGTTGLQGHVAFYVDGTSSTLFLLGGNQSDSVCVERHSRDHLLGLRWPAP